MNDAILNSNKDKPARDQPGNSKSKLIELGNFRFEPGYWQSMRQSAVQAELKLTWPEVESSALSRFDDVLSAACGHTPQETSGHFIAAEVSAHPVLGRVLGMTLQILGEMGMPVMGGATAMRPHPETQPNRWVLGLPALSIGVRAPQATLGLVCLLMNEFAAGKNIPRSVVEAGIHKLGQQFRPLAPRGINTLSFLQAAHEMNVPWCHVANNIYQFGWGVQSRWLDSSFTDETSNISAGLARDKVASAKVLRDAGLPVPQHQLVKNAAQAVKVAEALGYPVVVKPANLDGGVGVLAGLRDAQAVRHAFEVNAPLTDRILVEQFIEGSDHRLVVVKDEVLSVIMRRSARVIGDGVRTVLDLIEQTNSLRETQTQTIDSRIEQGHKPILIDDETHTWLRAQGYDLSSVVASGVSVRLRGAANWSQGGSTRDVFGEAHPDNLDLAVKAAEALRLDIAGIDFLIPDISKSWRQSPGAICEVNAQPQFTVAGRHQQVLQRLVAKQGRIPVVLIMGCGSSSCEELDAVKRRFEPRDGMDWCNNVHECRRALNHTQTQLLIWIHEGKAPALEGLPVDGVDLLIQIGKETPAWPIKLLGEKSEQWLIENNPAAMSALANQLEQWLSQHISPRR